MNEYQCKVISITLITLYLIYLFYSMCYTNNVIIEKLEILKKQQENVKTLENIKKQQENVKVNDEIRKKNNSYLLPVSADNIIDANDFRKMILSEQYLNNEPLKNFDDIDIKNYSDKQMNFNDKINMTSTNVCDPVDKVNMLYNNIDNTQYLDNKNKTISFIYDSLTQQNQKEYANCKNKNCIIPSMNDDLMQRNIYKEDNTYKNYNIKYETDNANNGGYDTITPNDENDNLYLTL